MLVGIKPIERDALRHSVDQRELFAVIDATGSPEVPLLARRLGGEDATSLFAGTEREDYWAVAPYLVRVDGTTLDWLLADALDRCVLLKAAGWRELVQHLKDLLMVVLPDGKRWLFRYYDPRVLPAFLGTCDAEQIAEVFGPIRAFIVGRPVSPADHAKRLELQVIEPYTRLS